MGKVALFNLNPIFPMDFLLQVSRDPNGPRSYDDGIGRLDQPKLVHNIPEKPDPASQLPDLHRQPDGDANQFATDG